MSIALFLDLQTADLKLKKEIDAAYKAGKFWHKRCFQLASN